MSLPPGLYTKRGWWYYQPPQRGGYRPPALSLRTRDLSAALSAHRDIHVTVTHYAALAPEDPDINNAL